MKPIFAGKFLYRHLKCKITYNHLDSYDDTLFCILGLLLLSSVGMIYTAIVDDGRPWCDSEHEIEISFFRNTFDSSAYWVCYELNTPATLQRCPDQTAFLDSVKSCVPWDEWEWESPAENRSRK